MGGEEDRRAEEAARHARLQELFTRARSLEGRELEAFLGEECGGDEALQEEVLSLLGRRERAAALDVGVVGLPEGGDEEELVPESIGGLKVLRRLGRGSFGSVYLARQASANREVAVKVLRNSEHLGKEQKERLRSRFKREAEALGRLKHPGVAQVYEAHTEVELPYLVMEYVEGTTLTRYVEEAGVDTRGRLELFAQICDAVGHAHQKGVTHRDLKPENILVAASGQPKVLDFGLARTLESELASVDGTVAGTLIGTAKYMSPEQAAGRVEDIDTLSDVYTLGVILFELLTGTLPNGLATKSSFEAARTIVMEEPTRLRDVDKCFRGGLDAIVACSLEKDKERRKNRIQSANNLARQVRRHLSDDPLEIEVPGWWYEASKLARKHRALVFSTATIVVSLVAGTVVSLRFAIQAEKSESTATARLEEVLRLSDVKRLQDYLEEAEHLWPAAPEKIPELEAWIAGVGKLIVRVDEHRKTLARLRAEASGEGAPLEHGEEQRVKFGSDEARWQHDTLAGLIAGIAGLESVGPPEGALVSVRKRLEFARTVRKRTIEDYGEEWKAAIVAIGDPSRCPKYAGKVRLKPQVGLIPIGQDSDSCLWEFAHLASGDPARRGADGKLELTEKTGIVFVLLPGGSFFMGSGAQLGTYIAESDDGVRVTRLVPGSVGEQAGLQPDDRLLSVNDRPIKTRQDLRASVRSLRSREGFPIECQRGEVTLRLQGFMGPNVDPYSTSGETPVHEAHLDPFFISKFEMTQGQWQTLSGANPSYYGPDSNLGSKGIPLLHPVEQVSWSMCHMLLGRYALLMPTEAQWEYACRAGTETVWWTGDDRESVRGAVNIADKAAAKAGMPWVAIQDWPEFDDGWAGHAPVGTFRANGFGLHEVHGNVWEWCRDLYGSYSLPTIGWDGERAAPSEESHLSRGGGFRSAIGLGRSSGLRYQSGGGDQEIDHGVRPAMRIED